MSPGNADLSQAVARAATLLARDAKGAVSAAEAVLRTAPGDPRALLILASGRRRLGQAEDARTILEPLARAFPRAALTQYELGATLFALGDLSGALPVLRSALALKPDLAEAWRTLGDLLFATGCTADAEKAFAEHARAIVQNPLLRPAAEAIYRGDLEVAERLLSDFVRSDPRNTTALRMLGNLYVRLERYADAEAVLADCLEIDPDHYGARFDYADALFRQQKGAGAVAQAEHLLALDPKDPAFRNLLAACLTLVGEEQRAREIHERLAEDFPMQPQIWLNLGHCLRTLGRRADAEAAYRRCIALAPGTGDAYWGLANMKVSSFSASEREAVAVALASPDLRNSDKVQLHYAMGKTLEDEKEFARAFEHYANGARLRRADRPYDREEIGSRGRQVRDLLTAEFFSRRREFGADSDAPIFIVGLPRSGSTLVEQILASHSQVEGTMELPDINLLARELENAAVGAGTESDPSGLASLDEGAAQTLGDRYLRSTAIHRKLGRAHFIDKMPNNFQYIGLIQLILPNARIVDVRRHPLGACFSAFKQHFAQGQSFTYDLTDLGFYYRDYVTMMAHFDAVLPGRVHRLIYEDLVENTDAEVRRLLAYCGLEFEKGCLRFHDNDRAVRTVSSEQVRQPIFRDGLEQWRQFEAWLGPLEQALGSTLQSWRS